MPSTVMLAVHAKKSEQLDLKAPLLAYVTATYGPQVSGGAAAQGGRRGMGGGRA